MDKKQGTSLLELTILFFWFSDMGCHIDGFIAVVAHTHVIQEGPITGRQADVIAAANTAAEVALRLVRPGKNVSFFLICLSVCVFQFVKCKY